MEIDPQTFQNPHTFDLATAEATPMLLRLATRMLGCPDAAREAVQEAALSAWASVCKFEGKSAFSTWLYRITQRECLMIRRKRKTQDALNKSESLTPDDDELPMQFASKWPSPLDIAIANERRLKLQSGLSELPDGYRKVLQLRCIDDLPVNETAAVLGIGAPTVKSQKVRAQRALKKILARSRRNASQHNGGVHKVENHLLPQPTLAISKSFSVCVNAHSGSVDGSTHNTSRIESSLLGLSEIEATLAKNKYRLIQTAFRRLSRDNRQLIELVYEDQFSKRRIAAKLKISTSELKKRLENAHQALESKILEQLARSNVRITSNSFPQSRPLDKAL